MEFRRAKPWVALTAALSLAILAESAAGAPSGGAGPASGPSSTSGGGYTPTDPSFSKPSEYRSAKKLIKKQKYAEAIPLLLKANQKAPNDADILNELGFSYRETNQMDLALQYYIQALQVDPDHKATREYLGELYLRQNQLPMAMAQLDQLKRICPNGCNERKMLEKAIADYQTANAAPAAPATTP